MANSRSKKKNNVWIVLVPVLVIILLVIGGLSLIKSQMTRPQKGAGAPEVRTENTLPDFTLTHLDGKSVKVSDIRAKIFMINFWATWCEACVSEMPSIVQLRNAYKDRGFEVLGVNLDENPEAVVPKAIQQLKMDFPVFKDPEGKTADLFDVHAIPLTVIMDHQRKILFVRDGEQDWNSPSIRSKIEEWLAR